jgi:hypothetical protein
VQGYVRRTGVKTLAVTLAAVTLSCGRSENVGWAEREMPDSAGRRAEASQSDAGESQTGVEAIQREYDQLSRSLKEIQMRAMVDSQLSALWTDLVREVDAFILAKSTFHRQLIERRNEIKLLVAQSQRPGGESLSQGQLAELGRHYQNIQIEMARVRSQEFQRPEFVGGYLEFQAALFARMRQLEPNRTAEIDRMEELEMQLFQSQDPPGPVPGMSVVK